MALKFWEKPESRSLTELPRAITLLYGLSGTTDHNTVRSYALSATPLLFDGLWRQTIKITPNGWKLWTIEVPFGPKEPPEPREYKWAWDTTGGTAHITQAVQHIQSYAPAGKTAPDHKGAIGVKQDGEVEGCDIVVPSFKWTETHQLPAAAASWGYSQMVKAVTGRVNNAAFRGFPAGQVRFDGAQGGGSNKDPNLVEVTFHFVQQDDVDDVTVGDITGVDKDGWQYSWVEYALAEDSTAKKNASRPIAAHIERVYHTADFSLLGIGT